MTKRYKRDLNNSFSVTWYLLAIYNHCHIVGTRTPYLSRPPAPTHSMLFPNRKSANSQGDRTNCAFQHWMGKRGCVGQRLLTVIVDRFLGQISFFVGTELSFGKLTCSDIKSICLLLCMSLLQVWAKFGHPILRRSLRRVLRLYVYTSHSFFWYSILVHVMPYLWYPLMGRYVAMVTHFLSFRQGNISSIIFTFFLNRNGLLCHNFAVKWTWLF